jgi:hypothetical protein
MSDSNYNPDYDMCGDCGIDLCHCQPASLECDDPSKRIFIDFGAYYGVRVVYPCKRCGGCDGCCHEADEDEPGLN